MLEENMLDVIHSHVINLTVNRLVQKFKYGCEIIMACNPDQVVLYDDFCRCLTEI